MSFSWLGHELVEVGGTVDINGDAREIQDDAGFSDRLRGGVVGFEAVVPETQGKQICGAAEGGVGASSVGGGDEDGPFCRCVFQDFFEFPRLNQGNVGGDNERAIFSALDADARGHLDGASFSGIVCGRE